MASLLHLILGNSALELVPRELWSHPAVVKHAKLRGKKPGETLLDRSLHHTGMLKLKDGEERGRPDLVHFALLEATSTPLYIQDMLRVYVHTCRDYIIYIGESVRLPKTYLRFAGLMEQLFKDGIIRSGSKTLLRLERRGFKELIDEIKPSITIGLSRLGVRKPMEDVARELTQHVESALVVGGFPRGHFPERMAACFNTLYSIHKFTLEAHVVIARILHEYEKCVLE